MTKKLIEQLVTALTHAIARLNALAHNYSDTDFTLLQDALAAGEAEVKFLNGLPPKKPATPEQPATLWLELYNLGEDAGVTFQITQFHQHGGITRIQLDTEDDFFLLPYDTGNGCWLANVFSCVRFQFVPL